MLFMIAPNGSTRASSVAKAPNGAIIEGNASDVSVLQANKFNDFRVAYEMMGRIVPGLSALVSVETNTYAKLERNDTTISSREQ